ncbi:MAG: endonuclease/exonuclease/phosphatase family protein [Chloroflexota bacterium]
MVTTVRIATFNMENLTDGPDERPPLAARIAVMKPQLTRLNADVLCLQEIIGTATPPPDHLVALDTMLAGTQYAGYNRVFTAGSGNTSGHPDQRCVILSRFPITSSDQLKNKLAKAPRYQKVTAQPPAASAENVAWERPILYAKVTLPGGKTLHTITVHLKSKIPTDIAGQKVNRFVWKSAAAWAEGSFISSMKRVGQALEVRILVDQIFDAEPDAFIVVCGDFNADLDDVPLAAIRGDVENNGNKELAGRVLVPCEKTIPEPARYSLFHHGRGEMIDHLLISRPLLAFYRHVEIHNEVLHDESVANADDPQFPESDHAPVVAELALP